MSAIARIRMRRSSSLAEDVCVATEDVTSRHLAFNPDNLGPLAHHAVLDSARERFPDRRFRRAVGHQDDRHDASRGGLFRSPLLHNRLERNELLAHPRRDGSHGSWTVNDGEAHVIAAFMSL